MGPVGPLFDELCRITAARGAQTTVVTGEHTTLGVASHATSSITVAVSGPECRLVAFGSGVRRSGVHNTGERASASSLATLVDGSTEDVVAVTTDGSDSGDVTLIAGRGDHRLYVLRTPHGGVVACSHAGVLAAAAAAHGSGAVDRSYENMLLGYGFVPDGRTVFADIQALPAGTTVTVGSDGSMGPATPLPQPSSPKTLSVPVSFDAAVDELHDRFLDALSEQASGDTRHAVLLGGLDSALVAASLRRLGHEVHTYTFGFGDETYEQRNVAGFTAAVGTVHHTVPITPSVIMNGLENFGWLFDQPGPQPHYQLHTLTAARQIASDGFDHVFTGDGADAVFLGYPTVSQRARLTQTLTKVPAPVASVAAAVLGTRAVERHLGHVARMARANLDNLRTPWPERGHLPTRLVDDRGLRRLRQGNDPAQAETPGQIRRRLAASVGGLDPVRLAFDGHALVGQSRVKVDGAVAATGVAQSSPFRHPAVRDWVASLPTGFLRTSEAPAAGAGKELLVAMVRKYNLLPDVIVDQPKQSPSDAPVDCWYASDLRPRLTSLLGDLPFEIDHRYLDDLLRPKWAEELFRRKVSISHHAFQVVGLLASYAGVCRVTKPGAGVSA